MKSINADKLMARLQVIALTPGVLLPGSVASGLLSLMADIQSGELAAIEPEPMDEPYLIWSNEHGAWWREGRSGYTDNIDRAGHYTRTEAVKTSRDARNGWRTVGSPSEVPIRLADANACLKVGG